MSFDALSTLRASGTPIDVLSEDQRAVFAGLSKDEVDVLTRVQSKLNAVSPETEGQDIKFI